MRIKNSLLLAAAVLVGCSSGNSESETASFRDASVSPMDAGTQPELMFESTRIDGLSNPGVYGDYAVLALDPTTGEPAIAYAAINEANERQLRYARRVAGQWSVETILTRDPTQNEGSLVGLGFAFVDGVPHVTYIGGDNDGNPNTPYPTDLALRTRTGGEWSSEQLLAQFSSDAASVCPDMIGNCASGNVVGTHSAIAARGGNYVVGYRDTYCGFGDTDLTRSDVDVFASGLSFTREVADPCRSGGAFLGIALTVDGRPVIAYNIEEEVASQPRKGVWVSTWNGTEWLRQRLGPGVTSSRTSVAAADDGTLYVAYFDSSLDKFDLVFATSTNGGLTWETEETDEGLPPRAFTNGKVGLDPSVALDADGRPVIAYTYCGETTDRDCPGSLGPDSEVRLARPNPDGTWNVTLVSNGDLFGGVGRFNSVAVAPGGTVYVAYQNRQGDLFIAEAQP